MLIHRLVISSHGLAFDLDLIEKSFSIIRCFATTQPFPTSLVATDVSWTMRYHFLINHSRQSRTDELQISIGIGIRLMWLDSSRGF